MEKVLNSRLMTKQQFISGALVAWCCLLAACSPSGGQYVRFAGMALGTTYSLTARIGAAEADGLPEMVAEALDDFEESLSTYRPGSVISRINRNETDRADSLFRTVFTAAEEVYAASDGLFDITVTPLVNAWGFGFTGQDRKAVPAETIDSLLQFVGMDKVRLSGDTVLKQRPEIMFNMNAIAKGFAVDVLASLLEAHGATDYMVEVGGEIRVKGRGEQVPYWRIGIDCPVDNALPGDSLQAILKISDAAVATSGNYRRFFEVDGVKYAHTINPRTGYPTQDSLLSVTIVTDRCMMADAWATACMASGYSGALRLLGAHPELDAMLIYGSRDGSHQVFLTDGFKNRFGGE